MSPPPIFPLRCQIGAKRVHIEYRLWLDEEGGLSPEWWVVAPSPPDLRFNAIDGLIIQGLIVADYVCRVKAQ